MDHAAATQKAKQILDEGGVVGIPTETVYGLAARIDIPSAIEKIFTTKERPFFDPLIIHVSSIEQAKKVVAYWSQAAQVLAEAFWPGPLTMVLPKDVTVNSMITSGLNSVGVRMPNHQLALDILKQVGVPLAAPSANKFGRTSPTSAQHVQNEFKNEDVFVVDGGDCQVGIESTVLHIRYSFENKAILAILRKGHVLKADIEKALLEKNVPFEFVEKIDKRESPGHMKHHYMPPVPFIVCSDMKRDPVDIIAEVNVKLNQLPDEVESIKIIKPTAGINSFAILNLSHDPVLAAREFYAKLRDEADRKTDCIIFYRQNYHVGERWESLFDRLNKAASLMID